MTTLNNAAYEAAGTMTCLPQRHHRFYPSRHAHEKATASFPTSSMPNIPRIVNRLSLRPWAQSEWQYNKREYLDFSEHSYYMCNHALHPQFHILPDIQQLSMSKADGFSTAKKRVYDHRLGSLEGRNPFHFKSDKVANIQ
jgi:hypothetical protein